MKIAQFWKKYKLYIIIGIVLGIIFGLVYYWFSKKNPPVAEEVITPINAPFETQRSTVTFSGYFDNPTIPSKLEIYKTSKPDIAGVENFAKRFTTISPYIGDDLYFWAFSGANISYNPSTSLLFLNSEEGLVADIKIGSKSEVKSFLLDYLNIKDIEISGIESLGNGRSEYKGSYVYETLQYGSLYLDGYAVNMVADNSKIYSLSVLLLTESNIVPYQQMPTVGLMETFSLNNDIYTKYLSYDENYKKQYPILQASAKLKSVEVQAESYKYVYLDSNYGYVFPVYEIKGSGLLIDSQNNEYWAGVLVYTSAFDRAHINKVESFQENMIMLDQSY